MGSTASHSSLVQELHGEDTAWWEQVLQQSQAVAEARGHGR